MGGNRRIGILGGTFDPIHIGHLSIARYAMEALSLDEVILMPNGVPAWKLDRDVTPASDRWAMAWLATKDDPRMSVSRMEVDRQGITVTVDTIRCLHETLGADAELWLIAGADTVAEMPLWEGIGEIARSIRIVAVARPGMGLDAVREAIEACPEPLEVDYLEIPPMDISSTMIREMIHQGHDISLLVGDTVARYIHDAGLYKEAGIPCGERDGIRPDIVVGRDCVGVGVGAIIIRDNKLLMLRRNRIPEAGLWDLPGGKVDLGETMEAAVAREVMEETGLDVVAESIRLVAVTDHIVPADEMHFVVLGFLMRADGEAENREPIKHSDMRWFPMDSLPCREKMTSTTNRALDCLADDWE